MDLRAKKELLKLLEKKKNIQASKNILLFTRSTMEEYSTNWHHSIYCKKIDDFMSGKIKNLMVFMPPQHGKSEISTRRVPAKLLGDNPDLKIGIVSYNHTIATKFNKDVQRIIESEEYGAIYPKTNIGSIGSLKNANEFEIDDNKGSLVSVGIGGGLTSRKLDIAIMDDLYKDPSDAWSPVVREKIQDWYDSVLRTRLHNESKQLLVFTRWHEDDLAGYLLRTEPENWEVVKFEAVKENECIAEDPREVGEALWESQHSIETLLKIKKFNSIIFDSLYQQNPTPKEGLLISREELNWFTLADIPTLEKSGVVAVCDVADEGEDRLSFPIGYQVGKSIYIIDVVFSREPTEVTKYLVAEKMDFWKIDKARFESNNGGKGYAQMVQDIRKGNTSIDWKRTAQNKHTKIIMKSGKIKENFYFLKDSKNQEYVDFVNELTRYAKNGKAKHDDAIDSCAMLEDFINGQSWGW